MDSKKTLNEISRPVPANLFALLRPYMGFIILLVVFTVASSGLGLVVPKIISHAIDGFVRNGNLSQTAVIEFLSIAIGVFILTYVQGIVQTYASERVARDLRKKLTAKISVQDYAYVEQV